MRDAWAGGMHAAPANLVSPAFPAGLVFEIIANDTLADPAQAARPRVYVPDGKSGYTVYQLSDDAPTN
jgi:hypothetical protein